MSWLDAGKAGNNGTTITFVGPDKDQCVGDLTALKESRALEPEHVINTCKEHAEKAACVLTVSSGFM